MFQELEIIEDFILKKLSSPAGIAVSTETLEAWLAMIQDEGRKAKQKITSNVLHLPDETHIEVFIQSYQRQLTDLADKLYTFLGYNEIIFNSPDNKPLSLQKIQKTSHQILEDLIDYLRTYFRKFFLLDEKPTRRKILIAVLQFTENINDINTLSENPNVFLDTIASALSDFINHSENITYRKIDYLHKLVEEVLNFNHQCLEKDLSEYLKDKLFYLNFNSVTFVEVLIAEFKKELSELHTLNDKVELLSLLLKKINQTIVQDEFIYLLKHRSLKEQVSHWLLEEMCFLDQRIIHSNLSDQDADGALSHVFKILTDLSVPQLAYFLRILVETEVIKDVKDKELLKFYAKYTKTRRTENISSESLRIKFYDIEDSTKEEVKGIVIRLLNYIQNNKNYIIFLVNAYILQLVSAISYISEDC